MSVSLSSLSFIPSDHSFNISLVGSSVSSSSSFVCSQATSADQNIKNSIEVIALKSTQAKSPMLPLSPIPWQKICDQSTLLTSETLSVETSSTTSIGSSEPISPSASSLSVQSFSLSTTGSPSSTREKRHLHDET